MPRLRQYPHDSADRAPSAAGTASEGIPDRPGLSFTRHSGLAFGQNDGSAPHIVLAAHAPGTHGISVMRCRFDKGLQACGTSLHHMIYLTLAHEKKIACRIDDRRLDHVARRGNLTIIPEGAICTADGVGLNEGLVLVIPKETLSFAAAERSNSGASVIGRLEGEDPILLRLGKLLAQQIAENFVDGPLAWYELTEAVTRRLVEVHLTATPAAARGMLSRDAFARVIDCIHAGVERQLSVDELADAAQQSRSHFPRVFRRSVGMSPYQYVIKVRLKRALAMLPNRGLSMAEIAVQTGFADQSHMCRWMRRAYGAAPTQLAERLRRNAGIFKPNRDRPPT
jgi:AraC family transcriptional regulator